MVFGVNAHLVVSCAFLARITNLGNLFCRKSHRQCTLCAKTLIKFLERYIGDGGRGGVVSPQPITVHGLFDSNSFTVFLCNQKWSVVRGALIVAGTRPVR